MAELSREEMRRLARLGAQARLIELKREEGNIRRAFPELFRASTRPAVTAADAAAARFAAAVVVEAGCLRLDGKQYPSG